MRKLSQIFTALLEPFACKGLRLVELAHFVSRADNAQEMLRLIEEGVNLEMTDEYGNTPLTLVVGWGNIDVARALVAKGADVNARNQEGWTPLLSAAANNRPEIVKLLVENGARLEEKDNDGNTPLMRACQANGGYLEIVRFLLEKGVDPERKNNNGKTALDIARPHGKPELVRLLEEARRLAGEKKAREDFAAATKAFREGLGRDITLDPPLTARYQPLNRPSAEWI